MAADDNLNDALESLVLEASNPETTLSQQPPVEQQTQNKKDEEEDTVTVFCCQRCRCILFTADQLSNQHETGQHKISYRRRQKDIGHRAISANPSQLSTLPEINHESNQLKQHEVADRAKQCSCLFVSEPNTWMSKYTGSEQVTGKLSCPSCTHRVGTFAWAGSQCSCGTWIVPALKFPINKVDPRVSSIHTLPNHVQDLIGNEADDVEGLESKETSEEQSTTQEQAKQTDVKVCLHEQWFRRINEGDASVVSELVFNDEHGEGAEESSLTTVQKKCFEGFSTVVKACEKSTKRLAGKMAILEGPVSLPAPSTTTRLTFRVEDIPDTVFGESIFWVESQGNLKAQHILRVKNPSEAFLSGGR